MSNLGSGRRLKSGVALSKNEVVGLEWIVVHELDLLGLCSGGGKHLSIGLLP